MEPRIHAITLAVADLDRAFAFYHDGLGLEGEIFGHEFVGDATNPDGTVAMFQLRSGLILAVWPRTELAKDAHVADGPPKTGEFSIGQGVASKEEVDRQLAQAEAAGATVTVPARDRPWGSMRATSVTRTVTCGRSCGTRSSRSTGNPPSGGCGRSAARSPRGDECHSTDTLPATGNIPA